MVQQVCKYTIGKKEFAGIAEAEEFVRKTIKPDEGMILQKNGKDFICYGLQGNELRQFRFKEY